MSSLPQPVTAISVDDKPRRGGLVGMLRSRWSRFKQSRNSGSNPSMFDKDFPAGGGSTEASTSITGPADEGVRRREVYYALPIHKSSHGDDSFLKSRRKRTPRGVVKSNYTAENDPDELGDVNEVVVDNSFEIGGQQESLTEPSADHRITENQPAVVMQAGQGKIKGGAFGWDPKDKQNGMQMSSSQLRVNFIETLCFHANLRLQYPLSARHKFNGPYRTHLHVPSDNQAYHTLYIQCRICCLFPSF